MESQLESAQGSTDRAVDDPVELLQTWPVGLVAAAWSTAGELQSFGPITHRFALASVTKPIFAYAVLIASEEGTLPLNSPLGPEGATVAHVLAHASGLGPEGPDPVTTPGTRRIYSNAGFELLGRALAAASGLSAADYMREAVCEPLGMNDTWLEGSPAHGAVSSVNDLVRFCHEWITPKLVSGITVGAATTPVMGELAGVLPGFGRHDPNPWGLGVEIRGHKQPHWTGAGAAPETFGHFGAAGTFVWVDPNTSQFAVCLTDTRFGPWAAELWPRFNQAIIGPTSATGQES